MKKSVCFFVVALVLAGCERRIGGGGGSAFSTSYVCGYLQREIDFDSIKINHSIDDGTHRFFPFFYNCLSFSMLSEGEEYDEYIRICRKHNDTNYVRRVRWIEPELFMGYTYLDVDPVAIDVVSDADFDELHSAGTSLGDLFYFNSLTPYPFIKNGYSGEELTLICKRLNELTAEGMVLSMHRKNLVDRNENYPNGTPDPFLSLPPENRPTAEQVHTLTVTIKDDYERTFTGKITVDFSQIETAD